MKWGRHIEPTNQGDTWSEGRCIEPANQGDTWCEGDT